MTKTTKERHQIQKEYRERLKKNVNEVAKEKNRIRAQNHRDAEKQLILSSSVEVQTVLKTKKQQRETERKKKYRYKVKNIGISPSKVFKRTQDRGKAVKRVLKALPKNATLANEVLQLVTKRLPKRKVKLSEELVEHSLSLEAVHLIKEFFESDDISWVSPLTKQRSPKSTTAVRNMTLSIRESYAEFKSRHPDVKVGLTLFSKLRPSHVKSFKETPENMCVCSIHANFGYLIFALYTFDKSVFAAFSSIKTFLRTVVCIESTDDCFLNECDACKDGARIKSLLNGTSESNGDQPIKYKKWVTVKKNGFTVDEKTVIDSTVADVVTRVLVELLGILKHTLILTSQSQSFKSDIKVAQGTSSDLAVIEVDFAENYKCLSQDQTQNANFCYNQVNIISI